MNHAKHWSFIFSLGVGAQRLKVHFWFVLQLLFGGERAPLCFKRVYRDHTSMGSQGHSKKKDMPLAPLDDTFVQTRGDPSMKPEELSRILSELEPLGKFGQAGAPKASSRSGITNDTALF